MSDAAARRPPLPVAAAALAAAWGALYTVERWITAYVNAPIHDDVRYDYVAAQAGLRYGWSRIYDLGLLVDARRQDDRGGRRARAGDSAQAAGRAHGAGLLARRGPLATGRGLGGEHRRARGVQRGDARAVRSRRLLVHAAVDPDGWWP